MTECNHPIKIIKSRINSELKHKKRKIYEMTVRIAISILNVKNLWILNKKASTYQIK